MPKIPENLRDFASLLQVVEALRGPEGCPWDKEQTHQSLTQYAIEETFELAEAIDRGDDKGLAEELGDVLLQVVLHSEIARQEGRFDIHDVIESISTKMVRRHPHVFAGATVSGSEEVLDNWADIKAKEKAQNQPDASPRFGFNLPPGLPALIGANKIGRKTKKFNFDWDRAEQVLEKIDEEVAELKEAMIQLKQAKPEQDLKGLELAQSRELGDVLFSVAQLARHLQIDPEQALRQTNSRFEKRFIKMQEHAAREGEVLSQYDKGKLEELWEQAKQE